MSTPDENATEPADAQPVITHNPERSRYEITIDGTLAGIAAYAEVDGVRVFNHTVVQDGFEGRGIAGQVVEAAVQDTVAGGGTFAATCSYVQHWLTKHHDYDASLVPVPAGLP